MKFVKKFTGHQKVCNYCRHTKTPKIIWKWEASLGVWFRYSHFNKKWMYWGPSKKGFTAEGWSYYRGYWHHGGFAFRYTSGTWWRYENRKWIKYGKTVPVTPQKPKVARSCRAYYKREKTGFSATLAQNKLPRCQVGKAIYMWTGTKDCRFLGGEFVYVKRHACKDHTNDEWRRVTKCVYEPKVTGRGLFGSIHKVNFEDRVNVTAKHDVKMAELTLNSNHSRDNTYDDNVDNKTWIKYTFNSPAPLSGLGIVSFGKTFNYVHIEIKYKDSQGKVKKSDLIRHPKFKDMEPSEVRLWTGHLQNVFEVEFFFENAKDKTMTVNEITFYQEKGAKKPALAKNEEEDKNEGKFKFKKIEPLRQILLED